MVELPYMYFLKTHALPIIAGLTALVLVGAGALFMLIQNAEEAAQNQEALFASERQTLTETLAVRDLRISELETVLNETKAMLEETLEERDELEEDLDEEKDRNEEFEDQIEKIGSTVGTLDKLSKTDEELLQKYSKVYFLNEHYIPPKLTEISNKYVYREGGDPEYLHAQAYPFFKDMVEDALADGVKLWVVSSFRSFDEQRALKGAYTITYGSGANAFSADQGYSEHQLGTTIDFTTENRGGALDGFDTTPAYTWLLENAHKYGFVLSYPKNNAYYIFEPWHWRFVGVDLAKDLHADNAFFYYWDQREIDKYLISIFD
jgi:D-alanyl-D-alanine carboxypeptidase